MGDASKIETYFLFLFSHTFNTHNSIMELAGNATRLFYLSEEGKEGRNAFLQKRKPAFRSLPTSKL